MKRLLLVMCSAAAISALSPAGANASGSNHRAYFQQQDKVVTGKVTDDKGVPLADATITVKNQRTSTATKADGTFTIYVPQGASSLIVTFIGMTDQEIDVSNKTSVTVTMMTIGTSMDDIVVIGYGSQKRSRLNNAVTSLNPKEVEDLPVGNLGAALAGRLLGVSVSGGTGRPGQAAQLVVRNPSSLSKDGGTNGPLYVIDDVIQITSQGQPSADLFNALDPSEVESITILKDAGAAIYGSRGANGVVVITTKRGKSGTPRITYGGSWASTDAAYHTKMLSAEQFALYMNKVNGPNGARVDPSGSGAPNSYFSQDEIDHFKTVNHDWLDQAWKASNTFRNTLNVSGGSDKATYFASVTNYKQDGNLGTLLDNKWTFRGGADVNLAEGVKMGLQVSGNMGNDKRINSRIGGTNVENDYRMLLRAPRYIPTYVDGLPVRLPGPTAANNVSAYHFFEIDRLGNYSTGKRNTSTINAYLEYTLPFLKDLKFKGAYGRNASTSYSQGIGTLYDLYTFSNRLGQNGHIYDGATGATRVTAQNHNRITQTSTAATSYQANLSAIYSKQIGDHNISAFFSVERSEAESQSVDAYKEAPVRNTNGQFNTAFGAVDGSTAAYETGTMGYIGRVGYNYTSRYSLDFLFRSDASTKFAPENYWGKFYSIGAGWVVSDEKFFRSNAVDYFKVRYSLGLLGKDDTRIWLWRQRYTFQQGRAVFGNNGNPANIGMKMEASPNRDATWSDDTKHNLGFDARFLKSRLSFSLDGYYNLGRNLLQELTDIPLTVGGTVAPQNYSEVNSFGYEIGIGWNENKGKDFSYGIDLRFSWSDNKVLKGNFNPLDILLPYEPRPGISSDNGTWGYQYLGMLKTQDDVNNYVQKYNITRVFNTAASAIVPGMLSYADVRGPLQGDGTFAGPDGIIDEFDQVQLSRRSGNHYAFGSTFKASYKGISLDFVIGGSFGGWSEMDAREGISGNINNIFQSVPAYWSDMWDAQLNPTGVYPNAHHRDVNSVLSSFWEVNSFRLRMVNANLSYTLPKKWVNAVKMSNARVVATALNPLNLYNPFTYKNSEGAWDNYPVLRTLSLGVNVTF